MSKPPDGAVVRIDVKCNPRHENEVEQSALRVLGVRATKDSLSLVYGGWVDAWDAPSVWHQAFIICQVFKTHHIHDPHGKSWRRGWVFMKLRVGILLCERTDSGVMAWSLCFIAVRSCCLAALRDAIANSSVTAPSGIEVNA
ncbi:uncharacterized protein QC761_0026450 [Podospora bellae-mahoneyi]|uniref:Uncharacterized protein n=1 Tax=Podospora bellae-mahoneyi TaxID=2093777 RepID=A0ABR0FUJ9_9PEZI|nr:hypothetical protein QC761_0026450 [Podospora bellae-mahoneyi]